MRFLALLVFLLVLGCAPTTKRIAVDDVAAELEAKKQRQLAVQSMYEDRLRLWRVAYRIKTKANTLCGDQIHYESGFFPATSFIFGDEFKEAAQTALNLTDVIKIVDVYPDSPAQRAGLKAGDVPLSFNDWKLPVGKESLKLAAEKYEEITKSGKSFTTRIIRDEKEEALTITPEKSCNFVVAVSTQDVINAFADGKRVIVTQGMMRFTKDDTELALVVSHELAHNAMRHMDAKKTNWALGSIFDILAGVYGVNTQGAFGNVAAQAYSQDFEAEADYVGLYMMAHAALDIDNAPNFWRRMAASHPGSIRSNFTASHPATPYRFVALEKAVKEIEQKQKDGAPLTPEMKDKK